MVLLEYPMMTASQVRAIEEFRSIASHREELIDLAGAGLAIARAEYPLMEIRGYLNRLDTMALTLSSRLPRDRMSAMKTIQAVNEFLFEELHFSGNRDQYYDPRNSYLNEVLDRRTGIPITLSLIYMEIARRIGLDLWGIGLPGHFIVKYSDPHLDLYIDPYNKGLMMTAGDCRLRVEALPDRTLEFQPEFLQSVAKKQILFRMLNNLKQIYSRARALEKALVVIEMMLAVSPENPWEIRDRALIFYQLKQYRLAAEDFRRYLALQPDSSDREVILGCIQSAEGQWARMN